MMQDSGHVEKKVGKSEGKKIGYGKRDAGCKMQDARCKMQDSGCKIPDTGCKMEER